MILNTSFYALLIISKIIKCLLNSSTWTSIPADMSFEVEYYALPTRGGDKR